MRNRWQNVLIVVSITIALIATLWSSYYYREKAQCQTDVNSQFLSVQRVRASIADEDRDSVRDLFTTIVNTQKLPPAKAKKAGQDAITRYFARQDALDTLRKQNPIPKTIHC